MENMRKRAHTHSSHQQSSHLHTPDTDPFLHVPSNPTPSSAGGSAPHPTMHSSLPNPSSAMPAYQFPPQKSATNPPSHVAGIAAPVPLKSNQASESLRSLMPSEQGLDGSLFAASPLPITPGVFAPGRSEPLFQSDGMQGLMSPGDPMMVSAATMAFRSDVASLGGHNSAPPPSGQSGLMSPPFSPTHSQGPMSASVLSSHGYNSPASFTPAASPPNELFNNKAQQRSISLQASQERLRHREDDRVSEDLSNSMRQAMGISPRLGTLELPNTQAAQPVSETVSIQDQTAVNKYFNDMAANVEAMRKSFLQGDKNQTDYRSSELKKAVHALESAPPPRIVEGPSEPTSRSGSVSSYARHSASNSIDSSMSSPPLSFPYPNYSAPSIASSDARSRKRSASLSDWDDEDEDSGRMAKSMRFSDSFDEDDDDDDFLRSPPNHPTHLLAPPHLTHAHSFPSMHDLPSQSGNTVQDQPLASPIPPRVTTISNATIVPNLSAEQQKTTLTINSPNGVSGLSHLRLPHLHIDTSAPGATASLPSSPVDYVAHAVPSYYPIQTWVNSTMPYSGLGFDGLSGADAFPNFADLDTLMSGPDSYPASAEGMGPEPPFASSQPFGGVQDPMTTQYMEDLHDFNASGVDAYAGTTGDWPSMDLDFGNGNLAAAEPAGEVGTTPMPTSLMQQSTVAGQRMADNRSAPSLSRAASRKSAVHKRPRRQASLSIVQGSSSMMQLSSNSQGQAHVVPSSITIPQLAPIPQVPRTTSLDTSSQPPPVAGQVPQHAPPSAFRMVPSELTELGSHREGRLPTKVKSESSSRPLSRQPSTKARLADDFAPEGSIDFTDLNRRLKSGRASPISSMDGDTDDEGEDTEGYALISRRPSDSHIAGKAVSRSNSRRNADSGPPPVAHASNLTPELKEEVDRVFFEFLTKICSNLEATDSKGELIHQALMPKKMQKLDESPDFRPFKFRIQAFTNAFVEELNRRGYQETGLPLKKIRTYLWSQPYISRYNEDGRKSKSKGNHIWNIHAKKLAEGGWTFREYHRKISGTPAAVAYVGLEWRWSPTIWDPQQSRSSLRPTFSSPSLPAWLVWKDNELIGTPVLGDKGGEIVAEAVIVQGDTEDKLTHTFRLEVTELPAGETGSTKSRRPSQGTDRGFAHGTLRKRSHTMSTAFTSESDIPPVPQIPSSLPQSPRTDNTQIRQVLEAAATRVAQEAIAPPVQGLPEAALKQRQASLAKQQQVLSLAAQAMNVERPDLISPELTDLVMSAKYVVLEAARQVADRAGKMQSPDSQGRPSAEPISVSLNEVTVATRLLVTKAINQAGLEASEVHIMKAATALIQAQPPQQLPPQTAPSQHSMSMAVDPPDVHAGPPAGFQNLASIHPSGEPLPLDMGTYSYNAPRMDSHGGNMSHMPQQS